jgi:hypothetical protein
LLFWLRLGSFLFVLPFPLAGCFVYWSLARLHHEKENERKRKNIKAASAFRNITLVPRHLKGWKGPLGYPPRIQELYLICPLHITIAPARVIDYYEMISSSKFPGD